MRFLIVLLVATLGITAAAQQPRAPQFEPIPAPPDVAKPPADAEKTASGLAHKVLQKGSGTTHPKGDDFVTVQYTGWTTDGKMFDSSHARNAASTFPVNKVIKGWSEGVQLMVIGEKQRFWIPQELAYAGQAGRPQGMLVFDVELLEISASPTIPPPRRRPRRAWPTGSCDPERPAASTRTRPAASPSITLAGRPTGSCSTAR